MKTTLNILIVIHDHRNRKAVRRSLSHVEWPIQIVEARTRAEALAAAGQQDFDAALLDDYLPDGDAPQVLADLREREFDGPILILTGADDAEAAVSLMKAGASDCLPKHRLAPDQLTQSLRSALRLHQTERERREALRQYAFYAAIVESTDDAVIGKSLDGTILSWNEGARQLYGYEAGEVVGRSISLLAPPERLPELNSIMASLNAGERVKHLDTVRVTRDGRRVDVALTISPIYDADGRLIGASTIARDITERKAAEQELRMRAERETLVNQISQAVLRGADPAALQSTALALLGERLAADRCFYVLYQADQNKARIEKDWCRAGISSLEGEWDLAERGIVLRDMYAGGRTVVIEDIAAAPLPQNMVALFLETGQRSYIAVPFLEGGRPVAALTVMMASSARVWSAEEVALMEAAAVQVRVEVEAARTRQREREALERQRTFLRDVLASVTEGRLILCFSAEELPARLTPCSDAFPLSASGGLHSLRQATRNAVTAAKLPRERGYDLLTAVGEAGMNAVVHAGEGTGQVCTGADELIQVWVTDQGPGIALEDLPHATLQRGYTTAGTFGHGMKIMLATIDRVYLLTGSAGTTVVLEQGCVNPRLEFAAKWGELDPVPLEHA